MNKFRLFPGTLAGVALALVPIARIYAADPYISEVMSANDTTLQDSFYKSPDWIEIYNPNE